MPPVESVSLLSCAAERRSAKLGTAESDMECASRNKRVATLQGPWLYVFLKPERKYSNAQTPIPKGNSARTANRMPESRRHLNQLHIMATDRGRLDPTSRALAKTPEKADARSVKSTSERALLRTLRALGRSNVPYGRMAPGTTADENAERLISPTSGATSGPAGGGTASEAAVKPAAENS